MKNRKLFALISLAVVLIAFIVVILIFTSENNRSDNTPAAHVTETPGSQTTEAVEVTATQSATIFSTESVEQAAVATQPAATAQQSSPSATLPNQPATPLPTADPTGIEIPREPVENQIVVQFKANVSPDDRTAYLETIGAIVVEEIPALNTFVVSVPAEVAAQPLPESPVIENTEPDFYVVALEEPNDPHYASQWALPVIGAPQAWENFPENAPPVTVAVIDTGVCANHPDLQGRVLTGYDFVANDANPDDESGHGCAVAGIIAANTNNATGIAGIAPNARIMPLRVLNAQGIGTTSDVAAAIIYAVDNGAYIINLSLGGIYPSSILESAVNYAASRDVLMIAAAGNSSTGSIRYPAAYPDVIPIGSIDPNLQQSSFSSYGPELDGLAPGRNILSTALNAGYTTNTGTSFAAPQVAGLAVLEIAYGRSLILESGIIKFSGVIPPSPTASPTIEATLMTPVATPTEGFAGIDTSPYTPIRPNISNAVSRFYESWLEDPELAINYPSGVYLNRGLVWLKITTEARSVSNVVMNIIMNNGGDGTIGENSVGAFVPPDLILEIADFPGVIYIEAVIPPASGEMPDALEFTQAEEINSLAVSQGKSLMNVPAWNNAGYTGEGVRIAIIDNSFGYYDDRMAQQEVPSDNYFIYNLAPVENSHANIETSSNLSISDIRYEVYTDPSLRNAPYPQVGDIIRYDFLLWHTKANTIGGITLVVNTQSEADITEVVYFSDGGIVVEQSSTTLRVTFPELEANRYVNVSYRVEWKAAPPNQLGLPLDPLGQVIDPHGTAVTEILYDIAPDAEYILAEFRFEGIGVETLLRNLVEVYDVDIIASSVGDMAGGLSDGKGNYQGIFQEIRNKNVLFVQSSGNSRKLHWNGTAVDYDYDGWVEFAPYCNFIYEIDPDSLPDADHIQDCEVNLILYNGNAFLAAETELSFVLRWGMSWYDRNRDFDFYLVYWDETVNNGNGAWVEIARADSDNIGNPPVEILPHILTQSGKYGLMIRHEYGNNWPYEVTNIIGTIGSSVANDGYSLYYSDVERSLIDWASYPTVFTVGAVNVGQMSNLLSGWPDPLNVPLEEVSSEGPPYFTPPQANYEKPDIIGYDRVSNVTYSSFLGTSAAAPHAAGGAALVWQMFDELNLYPDSTENNERVLMVQSFLQCRARDGGGEGPGNIYGYGFLYLDEPAWTISDTARNEAFNDCMTENPMTADVPQQNGDFTVNDYDDSPILTSTSVGDLNEDGVCGLIHCSLREAVFAANNTPGPDTIRLSTGTYILSITGRDENNAYTGDLDITDDLTIVGQGVNITVIDGGGIDRIFHVHDGVTATIQGVTLKNGSKNSPAGRATGKTGQLSLLHSLHLRSSYITH